MSMLDPGEETAGAHRGHPASGPARRLRLLMIMPFPPRLAGVHGGSRVTAQVIAALARRHSIAILYLKSENEPAIDAELARVCVHVEAVSRDAPVAWRTLAWRRWSALFGMPRWAADTWSPLMAERASALARAWKPDIVHFDFHVMAQYWRTLRDSEVPLVLTEHEPGVILARCQRRPVRFARLRDWLRDFNWSHFEGGVVSHMDAVVTFTARDREVLRGLGTGTPIVCIPFRLARQGLADASGQQADPATLLFLGNYQHLPNPDAAGRLLHGIFPRVRREIEGARLVIAGANPTRELLRQTVPGAVVTGEVEDPAQYLARATVVVVPLRLGGGMRVKVLEACLEGKAIVASGVAVDGLSLEDGVHFLRAETDEEFADCTIRLLRDPALRARLGRAVRVWAERTQDVDAWADEYDALFSRVRAGRA